MSLQLEDVQSTVSEIVQGVAPFKTMTFTAPDVITKHIFNEDGTIKDAVEDSLKLGWAIVVSPPMLVTTKSQVSATTNSPDDHGTAKMEVLTVVTIRTNPKSNTGPSADFPNRLAAIVLLTVLKAIIKGVLSWIPGPGETGFSLMTERPAEPDFEDIGSFTYDIRFLKNVSI